ncbi:MAG: amidohydrolase, partial [Candidatus Hydrogenedentota bacterium]
MPDAVLSKIIAKTDEIYPKLVEIRRQLHMHPELSGQEKETSALVEKRLRELGYEVRAGVGGYGVIGVMKGAKPGPVVAYRAD